MRQNSYTLKEGLEIIESISVHQCCGPNNVQRGIFITIRVTICIYSAAWHTFKVLPTSTRSVRWCVSQILLSGKIGAVPTTTTLNSVSIPPPFFPVFTTHRFARSERREYFFSAKLSPVTKYEFQFHKNALEINNKESTSVKNPFSGVFPPEMPPLNQLPF